MPTGAHHLARLNSRSCVAENFSLNAPVKLVILPRTRAGLGRSGLRHHLETIHGPMVMNEPAVSGRFTSYVHHYVQDVAAMREVDFLDDRDAVTIIRTPTMAELGLSKANSGYCKKVGPDEDNFREVEGSVALLAEEFEVAPGADSARYKLFIFRNVASDCVAGWSGKVSTFVQNAGIAGIIVNTSKVAEGRFPYRQFDEIGLPDLSNAAGVAAIIQEAALAHFGVVDTRLLFVEAVRFI